MIAVDSRDPVACKNANEKLRLMNPKTRYNLCVAPTKTPLSIAIITVPSDEWEYSTEINLVIADKDRNTSRVSGFAPSGDSGVMFFLPPKRDNDTIMRFALKRESVQVAVTNVADFRILKAGNGYSMAVSFILKTLPSKFTDRLRLATSQFQENVTFEGNGSKDQSLLAFLTLGLIDSGVSFGGPEDGLSGFGLNFYVQEDSCITENLCPFVDPTGLFGRGLPIGFGVAITYGF